MKLDGTVYCEGPDCETHQHVGGDTLEADRLPMGWVRAQEFGPNGRTVQEAFCGWDCLMKRAAQLPPEKVVI
jgi:hypothetical protein